jgi:Zn-dependent protease with chaperone function
MTKAVRRIGKEIEQISFQKETNKPLFQWTFDVILSPIPNAFCLPGGKIIVYSGLFDHLRNENELAAVLFHEAAHGIARHGAEKISFSLLLYGLIAFFFPDAGQLSDLVGSIKLRSFYCE